MRIRTADSCLRALTLNAPAAIRTLRRYLYLFFFSRALFRHHAQHLRNNLSGLIDKHPVADADILLGDIVLVVQGGIGHGSTRQTHRLQLRLWRQHTGTAHLHHDIPQHRLLRLRRVLVGDGPAGTLGGAAQHIPRRQLVQLDDRAVDVEGKILPPVAQPCDLRQIVGRS